MGKKIIAIIVTAIGGLMVISGVVPMVVGKILEAQIATSAGIIGGADGPTAIFVTGVSGTGYVLLEILVGVLLIIGGIWGYKKVKKQ